MVQKPGRPLSESFSFVLLGMPQFEWRLRVLLEEEKKGEPNKIDYRNQRRGTSFAYVNEAVAGPTAYTHVCLHSHTQYLVRQPT